MTVKKANAAPPKEPETPKVKREPVSPPKRAVKRGFEAVSAEDDENNGNGNDGNDRNVENLPGPSKGIPIVEIPKGRRVTRQSSAGINKAPKKARFDSESPTEFHDILKEQFDVISTAFAHIGDAFAKYGLKNE